MVFLNILNDSVIIYLDNVLIYINNIASHHKTRYMLHSNGWPNTKCIFNPRILLQYIELLGYIINSNGFRV